MKFLTTAVTLGALSFSSIALRYHAHHDQVVPSIALHQQEGSTDSPVVIEPTPYAFSSYPQESQTPSRQRDQESMPAEPETVEPETVEPETVEPQTVEPETAEPDTEPMPQPQSRAEQRPEESDWDDQNEDVGPDSEAPQPPAPKRPKEKGVEQKIKEWSSKLQPISNPKLQAKYEQILARSKEMMRSQN